MLERAQIQKVMIQCSMDQDVVFSIEADKEGPYNVLRKTTDQKVEKIVSQNKDFFQTLLDTVPDSVISREGKKYEFQDIKGKKCDLVVSFIGNEEQNTFEFIYGSESSQPPKEIMDIVKKALSMEKNVHESYKQTS